MNIACSVDSARNHYVLAEKLWTNRKYSAAVSEFEKVMSKDPRGKLGSQAMYRSAMTQFLFLKQYGDAVRKFRNYIQVSDDPQSVWDAQVQIGEILYSKIEEYDQAILHYRALLKQRPESPESPEFLFRIGKSHFFLFQFHEAIEIYREIIKKFPQSLWSEKASFEIGATFLTQGEGHSSAEVDSDDSVYQVAIDAFGQFLKLYPTSELVAEARFGIACCLEELDRLQEAYQAFAELKRSYSSAGVISVKLGRIRERMSQKGKFIR